MAPKPRKPKKPVNKNLELLQKAIRTVEKDRSQKFWVRVVEIAWTNPSMMGHLVKKLLPDIRQTELDVNISHEDWLSRLESEEVLDIEDNNGDAAQDPASQTQKRLTVIR